MCTHYLSKVIASDTSTIYHQTQYNNFKISEGGILSHLSELLASSLGKGTLPCESLVITMTTTSYR